MVIMINSKLVNNSLLFIFLLYFNDDQVVLTQDSLVMLITLDSAYAEWILQGNLKKI